MVAEGVDQECLSERHAALMSQWQDLCRSGEANGEEAEVLLAAIRGLEVARAGIRWDGVTDYSEETSCGEGI